MLNFKPMKAQTFGKDAKGFSNVKNYYVSIKYDGWCVIAQQEGNLTRWYTSSGEEFFMPINLPHGYYTLVGELMFGCKGHLGDRDKSAVIASMKKGLNKNIDYSKVEVKVFDTVIAGAVFQHRIAIIKDYHPQVTVAEQLLMTGYEAIEYLRKTVVDGWEGIMLQEPDSLYLAGKRSSKCIKIKPLNTADLLCVGVDAGKGKCSEIGALVLQDSCGRVVKVSAGLPFDPIERNKSYVGSIIEIEYERIKDTYIQPVFKAIRHDKTESD